MASFIVRFGFSELKLLFGLVIGLTLVACKPTYESNNCLGIEDTSWSQVLDNEGTVRVNFKVANTCPSYERSKAAISIFTVQRIAADGTTAIRLGGKSELELGVPGRRYTRYTELVKIRPVFNPIYKSHVSYARVVLLKR